MISKNQIIGISSRTENCEYRIHYGLFFHCIFSYRISGLYLMHILSCKPIRNDIQIWIILQKILKEPNTLKMRNTIKLIGNSIRNSIFRYDIVETNLIVNNYFKLSGILGALTFLIKILLSNICYSYSD